MPPAEKELQASILPLLGNNTSVKKIRRQATAAKNGKMRPAGKEWMMGELVFVYDRIPKMRQAFALYLSQKLGNIEVRGWSQKNYNRYANEVLDWLKDLRSTSLHLDANPVDIAAVLVEIKDGLGPLDASAKLAGLRRLKVSPRNKVHRQMAKFVKAITGSPDVIAIDGLHAWQPPASKSNVLGMEITEIQYRLPKKIDERGNVAEWGPPVRHKMSSFAAAEMSSNKEEFEALLRETPCGRVYLCLSQDLSKMFLASDFKPRRRCFVVGGNNPRDIAIAIDAIKDNDIPQGATLSGIVA